MGHNETPTDGGQFLPIIVSQDVHAFGWVRVKSSARLYRYPQPRLRILAVCDYVDTGLVDNRDLKS
jgi:hypothetical protein